MRLLKSVPHPIFGITLYSVNDKYLVKFEKAGVELGIKLLESEIISLELLLNKIQDPNFIDKIKVQFNSLDNLVLELAE